MKRREFMNWVGVGLLSSSLTVAIAACTPQETIETAESPEPEASPKIDSRPRDDGFAALGTVTDLDSTGSLAKINFIAGPVIVIRDATAPDSIVALNSMCTHQGCTVEWQDSGFACPCHGSKFNPDGTVANGPATEPLSSYEAKIEGDLVLIKVQ